MMVIQDYIKFLEDNNRLLADEFNKLLYILNSIIENIGVVKTPIKI